MPQRPQTPVLNNTTARCQSSTTLVHTLRLGRGWGLILAILLAHCLIVPVDSVAATAAGMSAVPAAPTTAAGMSAVQAARVTEISVGITEYATEHAGFRGTLKYRCADFIVREVSLDRRVIKLTSTKAIAEMPAAAPSTNVIPSEPALEGAARTEALAALIGQEQVRSFNPLQFALPSNIPERTTGLARQRAKHAGCSAYYRRAP